MFNYSIIIPHKNIPQLLLRCLDSIPRREDVQIIIVDDNSDSNIVDFNNFPGMDDPFIEIIFGKNEDGRKGAGYARNLGLERAQGKWIVFADADDFFMPCFSEVLDRYKDDENDIIYFKVISVDSDTLQPGKRHLDILDTIEQIQKNGNVDLFLVVPWGKFIRKEIIDKNNIHFSEIPYSNDIFFSVQCQVLASKKIVANDILYCVTEREGSLTTVKTIESLKSRFFTLYEVQKWLQRVHNKNDNRKWSIYNDWSNIYDISKIEAAQLLPLLIKACGWLYVCKNFLRDKTIAGTIHKRLKSMKNKSVADN